MSDTDTVAPILARVAAALRVADPLARGLRYTLAGNLSDAARTVVLATFADVDARRTKLLARRASLEALIDGLDRLYVPIPPQTVSASVLAELQQNANACRAALAVLQANPA